MHGLNRRGGHRCAGREFRSEGRGGRPGREPGSGFGHGLRGGDRFGRSGDEAWGGRGHGHGGHGGGRRRGKRFAGEELRLMVLALIAEQPRHGYDLIRAFAEKSGNGYVPSPGVLYPLLTLLDDMELVAEAPVEGSSRKTYAATPAGTAELETARDQVEALFARLAAMAEEGERTDAAPVRRAMMNLRTATMQRLMREGAAADLAFEIAAIIDEAAQKVERLP